MYWTHAVRILVRPRVARVRVAGCSPDRTQARTELRTWRLARELEPAALERLRQACACMLPEQANQTLAWLDPTQRMSPVDHAEKWGWRPYGTRSN